MAAARSRSKASSSARETSLRTRRRKRAADARADEAAALGGAGGSRRRRGRAGLDAGWIGVRSVEKCGGDEASGDESATTDGASARVGSAGAAPRQRAVEENASRASIWAAVRTMGTVRRMAMRPTRPTARESPSRLARAARTRRESATGRPRRRARARPRRARARGHGRGGGGGRAIGVPSARRRARDVERRARASDVRCRVRTWLYANSNSHSNSRRVAARAIRLQQRRGRTNERTNERTKSSGGGCARATRRGASRRLGARGIFEWIRRRRVGGARARRVRRRRRRPEGVEEQVELALGEGWDGCETTGTVRAEFRRQRFRFSAQEVLERRAAFDGVASVLVRHERHLDGAAVVARRCPARAGLLGPVLWRVRSAGRSGEEPVHDVLRVGGSLRQFSRAVRETHKRARVAPSTAVRLRHAVRYDHLLNFFQQFELGARQTQRFPDGITPRERR